MTLARNYLDAIMQSEGFTPRAAWDYKQHTNGYGTRAKYPGEVITQEEAQRRFTDEIARAETIVNQIAPNAPEGVRAALTSLTFNAGDKWASSGLGQAVRAGDYDQARALFGQYTKAGGESLPGLEARRQKEAAWFGGSPQTTVAQAPQLQGDGTVIEALLAALMSGGGQAAAGAGATGAAGATAATAGGQSGIFGSLAKGIGFGPQQPDMSGAADKAKAEMQLAQSAMQQVSQANQGQGMGTPMQRPIDLTRLREVVAQRPTYGIGRSIV